MNPLNHRPPLRILHTSDIHLLSINDRRSRGLKNVVDAAIENNVDLLLIVGDLFDETRVKADLLATVAEQFQRLSIPIVLLPGNHDCLVPKSVYGEDEYWKGFANVRILRQSGGETLILPELAVVIWGKPIDTYNDLSPLQNMPQPERNGSWNIALAHGWVVETRPDEKRAFLITGEEVRNTIGWDYIALGHIPRFQIVCEKPVACYSGSPTDSNTMALVELDEINGVTVQCLQL